MTDELNRKEWIKVFFNNNLYVLHEEYKAELINFLADRRTTIKYLQRKYGDIQDLVK